MSEKAPATVSDVGELHRLICEVLGKRLTSEDVSIGDINAAIKFVKDNGVSAVATPTNPLGRLHEALGNTPDSTKVDDEELQAALDDIRKRYVVPG